MVVTMVVTRMSVVTFSCWVASMVTALVNLYVPSGVGVGALYYVVDWLWW